ncbi:MAG TPA: oxidoreductase [Candidatus Aquabacterium excrementipullorum]|nr:oxidoreductase [Candidatus Aquabacterium excrementipullorum]
MDTILPPLPAMPPGTLPRVLLAGATGLVGGHLLRALVADPGVGPITVLTRRPLQPADLLSAGQAATLPEGKLRIAVVDYEYLDSHTELLQADWVFCALGTTIAQAGSQAAFRRVDHDYPLQLARRTKVLRAHQFLLVSAMGASARSNLFYNRVKGELEDALRALQFESLTLARPSLLLGDRPKQRLGEGLAARFGWLMPARAKPVQAAQVAAGLLAAAHTAQPGVAILDNAALRGLPLPTTSTEP